MSPLAAVLGCCRSCIAWRLAAGLTPAPSAYIRLGFPPWSSLKSPLVE
jgi:hypothetical protein